ncbi:MAG: 8-amino-7-oxononanoate synthase [Geobacteraceae bacterium]|nr:8-amino-7-oxononanoate synthase [Geobacteraceae bacterium]
MSFFKEELIRLQKSSLLRSLKTVNPLPSGHATVNGRDVILLCSNNYLGLSDHPALKAASIEAINSYGSGSGASRLVSGNLALHEQLETSIARFKGTESAILFNSGYAANTGTIQALVGRGDTIYSDRLNHASIVDGAILSRARLVRYPHNDHKTLRELLEQDKNTGRRLIITDGIFSMDGDIAPLKELAEIKRDFNTLLMVDDAHATGVMGNHGRGSADLLGVTRDVDIQMGTLGKGLGSCGAYVAGSRELTDYLKNCSRSFIFSTSLPPAALAASIAAIDISTSSEGEHLRAALESNRALFAGLLEKAGLNTMGSCTQILPVMVGGAKETMEFSKVLLEDGVFVQGIRPPTVPSGSCRLRCTVMANHEENDLRFAAAKIIASARKLGVIN